MNCNLAAHSSAQGYSAGQVTWGHVPSPRDNDSAIPATSWRVDGCVHKFCRLPSQVNLGDTTGSSLLRIIQHHPNRQYGFLSGVMIGLGYGQCDTISSQAGVCELGWPVRLPSSDRSNAAIDYSMLTLAPLLMLQHVYADRPGLCVQPVHALTVLVLPAQPCTC
jgi:hypothetical protein